MIFGIHSLLFKETFIDADLPLLDRCQRMGFDAVEIVPFAPESFPAARVRQAAADLGLVINLGYGMPEQYNVISPDAAVRRAGVDFGKRLVDLASDAGAGVLGGVIYCGWGYLTGQARTADEWQWGVDAFREIATHALDAAPRLRLAIEPVNRFESHFINVAQDAVKYCRQIGTGNVRVHLDTFHVIREENSIRGAVAACGGLLGYIHACENQRGTPGTGLFPWDEFFSALAEVNYDGCVTIESFDPEMPRIAKLCCMWRKLAESPEALARDGLEFIREIAAKHPR